MRAEGETPQTGAGPQGAGETSRPMDDTVAQTGPGIPDDAASPGYDPEADTERAREVEAHLPSPEALFRDR